MQGSSWKCGLQSNLDFQSNQIKSEGFQFCKCLFISKCFSFTLEIDVSICMTFTFFCASMHTHVMIDSKATLGHEYRERTAGPQFTAFPKFIKNIGRRSCQLMPKILTTKDAVAAPLRLEVTLNARFLASLSKVPMCTNGMPGSHTHFHSGGPGLFKHSITCECFCRVTGECLLCVVIPWEIRSYVEIVNYFCSSVGSPRPLYIHCLLPSEPNFIFLQRLWALSSIPFTGLNINPLLCL